MNSMMGKDSFFIYSNEIYVYKQDKLYVIPSKINDLFRDEGVKIDSTNVFDYLRKFIRMTVTDRVDFIGQYFIAEGDSNRVGFNQNVCIITNSKYGEEKWEFYVNLQSTGHISEVFIEFQYRFDEKGKKLKLGKSLSMNINNMNRTGESRMFWLNSIDQDEELGSLINIEDPFYNQMTLEGFKTYSWETRRSVVRKKDGVYIAPQIRIKHDYSVFDFTISYSYNGDGTSYELIKTGNTASDLEEFTIPETFSTSDSYFSIPGSLNGSTTTGIWRIEVTHNLEIKRYYFNVFDLKTGSFPNYPEGYRIYFRENEDVTGVFTTQELATALAAELPQVNSFFF